MRTSLPLLSKALIFTLAISTTPDADAQNQTVAGDLTVNGRADIISGPLSVGTASFTDDNSNQTTAEGLTLHYSEISQIWDQGNYVPGRSTIIHRVAQELADFHWQVSVPDTLGGYDPLDLMKLSSEKLLVTPSIEGSGTENILPNQTLAGGASSILTRSLADTLYLATSGGIVTGNVTFNGTVNVTTLGNSFTGLGTNYRLPNQIANQPDSIITKQTADQSYVKILHNGLSFVYGENATVEFRGMAMGYVANAAENAVIFGHHGFGGAHSVAMGYAARSPGLASIAIGNASWAEHESTISLNGTARTLGSIAIGIGSESTRPGQVIIGNYNIVQPVYHERGPSDHIFVVGNGTADNARSNAFIVKRNGDVEVTGTNLTVNGTAVLTQSAADSKYLHFEDDQKSIRFGYDTEVITYGTGGSIAVGYKAKANVNAISIGGYANYGSIESSGSGSVAIGGAAASPGDSSISLGQETFSSGHNSVAISRGSAARSDGSIAIGVGSESRRPGQVVVGSYNVFQGLYHERGPSDHIFVVGNGTADNARSNAFIVKRNGDVEVTGTSLTVNGTAVLTRGEAESRYLHYEEDERSIRFGYDTEVVTSFSGGGSIALGFRAKANLGAISIGGHVNYGSLESSGIGSVAIGDGAMSPGERSVSLGPGSFAAHAESIAIGRQAVSRFTQAIAIGAGLEANRPGQIVIGNYNDHGIQYPVSQPSDYIFVIGNGTADNARSNALIVRRNGDMEVLGTSLTVNGEPVLTEAALDAAIENVNLGGGNYISRNPLIGFAYGSNATATAHSIALGEESVASGTLSSSAMGYHNQANQAGTHALGNHLVANLPGQIVLGNYNDYGVNTSGSGTQDPADPIFVIGNGSADNDRSNALVIHRNGNIAITGTSLMWNNQPLLTQAVADSQYLSQASAGTTYLTISQAENLYQPKPEGGIDFLTSEDLTGIQAAIEAKIDQDELDDALANIEMVGGGDAYLKKSPTVGLAYGNASSAVAATSAIGNGAKTYQEDTHAVGTGVVANRPGQVVVGRYNDYGEVEAGTEQQTEDDSIFVVGAGTPVERKNALVVKRNGSVHVNGVLRVQASGNLLMGIYDEGPIPEE